VELAELVTLIVRRFPELSGLYQVASEPISKYDLLCLLKEAFKVPVEIIPDDTVVSDRSMKGDKLKQATGYQSPPWPELIQGLSKDPTPYDR
jgi:dTDP-4-dehydrorhamnose reductase